MNAVNNLQRYRKRRRVARHHKIQQPLPRRNVTFMLTVLQGWGESEVSGSPFACEPDGRSLPNDLSAIKGRVGQ